MHGVHEGQNTIEVELRRDGLIRHQGLQYRNRIRQSGRLDDDPLEIHLAIGAATMQIEQRLDEIASATTVREKAELWRPYRSVASMYVWQAMKLKLGPSDLKKGSKQ